VTILKFINEFFFQNFNLIRMGQQGREREDYYNNTNNNNNNNQSAATAAAAAGYNTIGANRQQSQGNRSYCYVLFFQ
jgi:hypothetical protein